MWINQNLLLLAQNVLSTFEVDSQNGGMGEGGENEASLQTWRMPHAAQHCTHCTVMYWYFKSCGYSNCTLPECPAFWYNLPCLLKEEVLLEWNLLMRRKAKTLLLGTNSCKLKNVLYVYKIHCTLWYNEAQYYVCILLVTNYLSMIWVAPTVHSLEINWW